MMARKLSIACSFAGRRFVSEAVICLFCQNFAEAMIGALQGGERDGRGPRVKNAGLASSPSCGGGLEASASAVGGLECSQSFDGGLEASPSQSVEATSNKKQVLSVRK